MARCARQTKKSKDSQLPVAILYAIGFTLRWPPLQRANPHPSRIPKLFPRSLWVFVQHNLSRPGATSHNSSRATAPSTRLEGNIRRNNRLPASERKRNHRGREIRHVYAHIHTYIMLWQRSETWTHAASSGLNRQLTDSMQETPSIYRYYQEYR